MMQLRMFSLRDLLVRTTLVAALAMVGFGGALTGCEGDSDLEDAAEEVGDGIEDAVEELD